MRLRFLIAALFVVALATSAVADPVYVKITEANFASLGWTRTLINGGLEPGQSCNFRADATTVPPYVDGVHPSPKKSGTNQLSWAGLGANLFDGVRLDTINHFRIRTTGFEGDGAEWEPPSLYLQVSKDGLNQRNIRFLPYASYGRGTAKTFYEYDLIGASAKYFCMIDATVKTWAQVLSSWPNAQFDSTVTTPLPGGKIFNVMDGCAINQEVKYGSSARGTVDWVEIGFTDGSQYIFDFAVPEPGSLVALSVGVIGLLGLRRRR